MLAILLQAVMQTEAWFWHKVAVAVLHIAGPLTIERMQLVQ
jgi:hypothetical protein